MPYLNDTGLVYLWKKIRAAINENAASGGSSAGSFYAVCSTAQNTLAKTAAVSGFSLSAGVIVAITFNNDVPASSTLNIENTGAKTISYRGGTISSGLISAGDTVTFIYDGAGYRVLSIDYPDVSEVGF